MEDVQSATTDIIRICDENGYQICETDNKLNGDAQSFVFKIKINDIVAEFQLALEFDLTRFEFGHAIYEI
jgi:hypothetical protein